MIRKIFLGVLIFLAGICGVAIASDQAKEQAAVTVAQNWLQLVDNGDNAQSWSGAASYFKAAVAQSQWEQTLKAVRIPLGKALRRQVKSTQYMTSMPGAPDGEYVVIQFDTSFEDKKTAVETVTSMMDKDGRWRVAGYYIK